jgi:hypothetical protein
MAAGCISNPTRDGFVCVWSQRLDPKTKRPIGAPQIVRHFHGALGSMISMSRGTVRLLHLSLAADRLILNLDELRSDLWLLEGTR